MSEITEQEVAERAAETARNIVAAFEQDEWPGTVDHMAELLGWSRLEAMFLWFTRQTIMAAHNTAEHYRAVAEAQREMLEKWGPIMDRIKSELDEGEDWKP